MASPQCENGYTKIANELLQAFCRLHNVSWIKIVLVACRITYGFNRKEAESKYSSFATITKLNRTTIENALIEMNDRKIVIYVPLTQEKFIIAINKDYEKWKIE